MPTVKATSSAAMRPHLTWFNFVFMFKMGSLLKRQMRTAAVDLSRQHPRSEESSQWIMEDPSLVKCPPTHRSFDEVRRFGVYEVAVDECVFGIEICVRIAAEHVRLVVEPVQIVLVIVHIADVQQRHLHSERFQG